MQHLDNRTLDEGPMDQLDLDFGDNGAFVPPPGACPTDDAADDDRDPADPHLIDCLDIAGRRYELDCRVDPLSLVVLGYALRLVPATAAA